MTVSLVVLTIIMFGGGGFMMGQALADTWRPWWQILPYSALMALGNNFLGFALFDGAFFIDSLFSKGAKPLSEAILEYVIDFVVILAFAGLGLSADPGAQDAGPIPLALRAGRAIPVARENYHKFNELTGWPRPLSQLLYGACLMLVCCYPDRKAQRRDRIGSCRRPAA